MKCSFGIFVATVLDSLTPLLVTALPHQFHRHVSVAVGVARIQGIDGPYIGKFRTDPHKNFLRGVIENYRHNAEQSPSGCAWSSGDFNLQGVAPGTGLPAKADTAHAGMSNWFTDELKSNDLEVVSSGPTYIDGTTLDIHLSRVVRGFATESHWLPRCYSDHAASIVEIHTILEANTQNEET